MIARLSSTPPMRSAARHSHDPERGIKEVYGGTVGTLGAVLGGALGALPGAAVGVSRLFSERSSSEFYATCDVGDMWTMSYAAAGAAAAGIGCFLATGPGPQSILAALVGGSLAVVPQKVFRSVCQHTTRLPAGSSFPSTVSYCADREMANRITNPWNGLLVGVQEGAKLGWIGFSEAAVPSLAQESYRKAY